MRRIVPCLVLLAVAVVPFTAAAKGAHGKHSKKNTTSAPTHSKGTGSVTKGSGSATHQGGKSSSIDSFSTTKTPGGTEGGKASSSAPSHSKKHS
jgi:hypothetical protein